MLFFPRKTELKVIDFVEGSSGGLKLYTFEKMEEGRKGRPESAGRAQRVGPSFISI